MARDLKQVTATGNVTTTVPAFLNSVAVTGAVTVDVRDGASGPIRLTLVASATSTALWSAGDREGVLFGTAIHATLTGTGTASFEFS